MQSFKYQIVRSKKILSNISIRITPERGVVVRAPFWTPNIIIDNFLKEKTNWIEKSLEKIKSQKNEKRYQDGEKHLFFGKEYSLKIETVDTPGRCPIQIIDEEISIGIFRNTNQEESSKKIKDALLHWYLEKGIEVITERVNYYSEKIGVSYNRINLKKVTSIWGSCSPTNCLSFNRKLVMAPPEVVDYVIIHEVSHMVHRNHGKAFWNLVGNHDPEYQKHRKWLKLNHHLLVI
ncbi:MAG TPA: SprT family zinc-dependent metalloprotease [Candidatus Woesebacteria bacterium]|nr:SprT family zinc-dependent metalloprotease [Candidatus Woesebacteria bacterium]